MGKEKFDSRNIFEENLEKNTSETKNWDDFQEINIEKTEDVNFDDEENIDSVNDKFIEEDYTLNDLYDNEGTNKNNELVKVKTYNGLPSIEDIESIELDDEYHDDVNQEYYDENEYNEEENTSEDTCGEDEYDDFRMEYKENKFKKIISNKNFKYIVLIFVIVLIIFMLLRSIGSKQEKNQTSLTDNSNSQTQIETDNYIPSDAENIVVDMTLDLLDKAKEETLKNSSDNNLILPSLPSESTISNEETQTYYNDKYGIRFDYPLDWEEIIEFEYTENSENVNNVVMVGILDNQETINNMRISIEDIPVSITSKQYIEKTDGLLEEIFPKFQSMNSGEITVSGREAPTRMYLWVPQTELERTPYKQEWKRIQQYQIYVSGKTKMYVITFTSNEDLFLDNFDTYETILKTLELGD